LPKIFPSDLVNVDAYSQFQAVELLRDRHGSEVYVFEAEQTVLSYFPSKIEFVFEYNILNDQLGLYIFVLDDAETFASWLNEPSEPLRSANATS
jgi:hypothetical protein